MRDFFVFPGQPV